jgi:hypothetical protein
MEVEIFMLSKMNNSQKDKCHIFYIICIIYNFYMNVQAGLFKVESTLKGIEKTIS